MWIILRLETHWDSGLDFVKFHILKLQTLISEPEPSLKTVIRNEVVIEMVQNLVCGAHLILTQYRVRLARSERGSADIWILGVFSDPSIFSEPRFSFPEVHFQTLSGNLWWIVMILIKTHRVEQLSTRLRPQIGFSNPPKSDPGGVMVWRRTTHSNGFVTSLEFSVNFRGVLGSERTDCSGCDLGHRIVQIPSLMH